MAKTTRGQRLAGARWMTQWLRAADMQIQSALRGTFGFDRQINGWMFAIAIANLERVAELILGGGHPDIQDFRKRVPDVRDVRDMVTHVDEYLMGTGLLQSQGRIQTFELMTQYDGVTVVLHIGERRLDMRDAYEAARDLVVGVDNFLAKEELPTNRSSE